MVIYALYLSLSSSSYFRILPRVPSRSPGRDDQSTKADVIPSALKTSSSCPVSGSMYRNPSRTVQSVALTHGGEGAAAILLLQRSRDRCRVAPAADTIRGSFIQPSSLIERSGSRVLQTMEAGVGQAPQALFLTICLGTVRDGVAFLRPCYRLDRYFVEDRRSHGFLRAEK